MVIEIHDSRFHQIFRNFKFYEFCSYSLEELHCGPWTVLYERDEAAMRQLMGVVGEVFDDGVPFVDCRGIRHVTAEAKSVFKLRMNFDLHYAWGLRGKNGRVEASLIAETPELLDPPSKEEEERLLRGRLRSASLD